MRITNNMYYANLYSASNSKLDNELYDVNKQIASGLNIEYAYEDVRTFSETMRLDNEIAVLGQIEKSTQSGYKISEQTDVILNEFETSMNRVRTLLVTAANGTNDEVSLNAIAKELRGVETHLKDLANSSINGQYLFSGTAIDVKPIAEDGTYLGNDGVLEAFTGSGTRLQYNINGAELFLGEELSIKREVTTNVVQQNQITKYAALQPAGYSGGSLINASSTIRDLMGDADNVVDAVSNKHFFYIRGTKSNGDSFEQKISLKDSDTISDLMTQIGDLYGNTIDTNVVNVSLNQSGQIVIEDKIKGSSKLDFHIIGATDLSGGAAANVNSIDALGVGESNFDKIMLGTSTATNPNLHVKEFIKSSLISADGVAATNGIEGTIYDRVEFGKNGSKLSSNVSQIIKGTNEFATSSTKILDVASGSSLDTKAFVLEGVDVNGAAYSVQIDLATAGSTFTVGANTYDIFNMQSPRAAVDADEMTYRQLMDVMNMVVTGNLPAAAPGTSAQYDSAIESANLRGSTFLTYDGKIGFQEIGVGSTSATIAMYDSNSGDFSNPASVLTFNTNNALSIRDPKTDFFKTIDEMITSVENYKLYPDSNSGEVTSVGIENAIVMMDDLQDHIFKVHSQVGAQSNALSTSVERVQLLELSTMSLRSSVIDTDVAESQLKLAQLKLNYEAMLSTVGKVSQLSLVNYL